MPNILDYYEYAKLATAAYVWLDGEALDGANLARLADYDRKADSSRIPLKLASQMFDEQSDEAKASGQPVWTVRPGGYYNDE